jgi:hypothetical protein
VSTGALFMHVRFVSADFLVPEKRVFLTGKLQLHWAALVVPSSTLERSLGAKPMQLVLFALLRSVSS